MFRYVVALVLFFLSSADCHAQTSTYVQDGTKRTVSWDEIIGQIVTVDGLAWGSFEKGLGQHLVLTGGRVYVRDVEYDQHDLNGHLLRITGYLRKGRVEKAPAGVQGYAKPFEYYYVQALEIQRIEKVIYDQLFPSKSDWVVIDGDSDAAIRTISRLGLPEYMLALTASKDGSRAHSYQISPDEVLVFWDLNGSISAISKIKLNDPGQRADDEWIAVKAYQLPRK